MLYGYSCLSIQYCPFTAAPFEEKVFLKNLHPALSMCPGSIVNKHWYILACVLPNLHFWDKSGFTKIFGISIVMKF